MTQKSLVKGVGFAVALALVTPPVASAQNRFHGLDRNRDGVVTRAEWRGNDVSFRNQDRNGDGILSGVELRAVPSVKADNGKHDNGKHKAAKAKPGKPVKAKPAKGGKPGRGGGQGGR